MSTILLVIHLMVATALVAVVLMQRSEGGALGIGGGGGGGFMTGRGAGNALTRATAILGAAFFATSMLLTILAGQGGSGSVLPGASPLDSGVTIPALPSTSAPAPAPAAPTAPAQPAAPEPPQSQ